VQCFIDLLYPVLVKVPWVRVVAKLASPAVLFPDPPKGTAPMNDNSGLKVLLPFALLAAFTLSSCSATQKAKLVESGAAIKACMEQKVSTNEAVAIAQELTTVVEGITGPSVIVCDVMNLALKYGPRAWCIARDLYDIWIHNEVPPNLIASSKAVSYNLTPRSLRLQYLVAHPELFDPLTAAATTCPVK